MQDLQVGALSSLLRELNLPLQVLSPLLAHASAVREEADRLGLVSAGDRELVVSRHTADSLLFALVREPVPGEHWVDVGSGAGFPGLVLAIAFPATSFALVEPQRRRAGFLELQRARLGLENCDVIVARAADLDQEFDVVVARALAEPPLALEAMARLRAPGGAALLAVGDEAALPPNVEEFDVRRVGVDSPGRIFMMAESQAGA